MNGWEERGLAQRRQGAEKEGITLGWMGCWRGIRISIEDLENLECGRKG